MTEDEALKRWCPLARIGVASEVGGGVSVNRSGPSIPLHGQDRCLGSGCMAWRQTDALPERAGYCGLAGKP